MKVGQKKKTERQRGRRRFSPFPVWWNWDAVCLQARKKSAIPPVILSFFLSFSWANQKQHTKRAVCVWWSQTNNIHFTILFPPFGREANSFTSQPQISVTAHKWLFLIAWCIDLYLNITFFGFKALKEHFPLQQGRQSRILHPSCHCPGSYSSLLIQFNMQYLVQSNRGLNILNLCAYTSWHMNANFENQTKTKNCITWVEKYT